MTRVLILDDRPINRQFLTTLLAYKRFETREAANGLEGLEVARVWPPDLAIVDIAMPGMDGVDFVRHLHAEEKFARTPIIFYTASYEASEARRLAAECGVAYVLMKPSEPEVILETIDRALGRPTAPLQPAEAADAAANELARLQTAAMRTSALVDFQLEIAAQRNAADILRTLARAARNVVASAHSVVTVGDRTFASCGEVECGGHPDASFIRAPLETATRSYGWLSLTDRKGGEGYTADDERIAQTIAAQAAIVYENLVLYDEVQREAKLLHHNIALLHSTIEANTDGIAAVDLQSCFVTFNQRFVEIWGIPEEIVRSRDADAAAAHSRTQVKDAGAYGAMARRAVAGQAVSEMIELIDGRLIECKATPRSLDGEVVGRLWTFRDVTARVRDAEALEKSEESYRTLIANIPDATWRADSLGNIHFVSPNIERMYGYSAEHFCSPGGMEVWLGSIHPDDRERVNAAYTALFERRESLDIEYRLQRKDGVWFWLHDRSLGTYERDGVTFADGVCRDVTRRKTAEAELMRVARERQVLIESTAQGIFAIDVRGLCTMANQVAAVLVGRPIEELVGSRIHNLIHHHKKDGVACPPDDCSILSTLVTRRPVRLDDEMFWRRDGSSFPVECTASPLIDAGVLRGAVVTFSDATERRQMERRLEQINHIDSLGRMAATIAHEFNNVLMGIQPFAEVIRRKTVDDEGLQKAAGHIMNSVARGKTITQDILRISKAAEPQTRSVELIPWLEQLLSEIRVLVGVRVGVELDVPAWEKLFIRCDPSQMQQVLTNLALNARDAMNGEGTLRIVAERTGGTVRMIVTDSGCGIPPETLPYIFEPLFTTKHFGTGLGLAVAQQIVMRNGGTISVESTVGEGTRFRLDFPAAPPPELAAVEVAKPSGADLGVLRVLIVEDEPSVALGLEAILESEGMEVRVVTRGGEAAAAVAGFGPDAVLLDMSLPDMSGAAVYEQLAARWPDVAVIFSTGHADESRLPKWSSKHVGFLRKPYTSEVLLTKLREVV
jgi:PAS domain S-box-containing protein